MFEEAVSLPANLPSYPAGFCMLGPYLKLPDRILQKLKAHEKTFLGDFYRQRNEIASSLSMFSRILPTCQFVLEAEE